MPEPPPFPRLVSLACHDLRTPLVAVGGFARTIPRVTPLSEQAQRFLDLIVGAAEEMSELIDDLSRAARIEAGRFRAAPETVTVARVAAAAAALAPGELLLAGGEGDAIHVDVDAAARSLAALARTSVRHGGEAVTLGVDGRTLRLYPVAPGAVAPVTGTELSELGAAVGLRVLDALGAEVALDASGLVVRFPSAEAARDDGP